jgi:hypothetical protein
MASKLSESPIKLLLNKTEKRKKKERENKELSYIPVYSTETFAGKLVYKNKLLKLYLSSVRACYADNSNLNHLQQLSP